MQGPVGPRRGSSLSNLGLIQDGAVLIVDGAIEQIGPSRRLESLARIERADIWDAAGRVVMPGFVDGHICAFPQQTGVLGRDATADFRACASRELHSLLRQGTTTVQMHVPWSGSERTDQRALRALHSLAEEGADLLACWQLPVLVQEDSPAAFPDIAWKVKQEDLVYLWRSLLQRWQERSLLQAVALPASLHSSLEFSLYDCWQEARRNGFHLHLPPGSPSLPGLVLGREFQARSVVLPASPSTVEIAQLAESSSVCWCMPAWSLYGAAPSPSAIRAVLDFGGALALSTGFQAGRCPINSMPVAISLACLQLGLMTAEALCAATINAAHALGCADRVGSLERGKQADLLVLNVRDYRELGSRMSADVISTVIKRGDIVYEQGEVIRVAS